ncbi:MAG: DUF4145 domain-containing protein [Pseudomonadota bacterium]
MNRKLFKLPFREKHTPDWNCPTCEVGLLRVDANTFVSAETRSSKLAHDHEDWDPEWIQYRFSTMLRCTNDKCSDLVSLSGTGSVRYDVEFDHNGQPEDICADFFQPKYFEPPLKIIPIPEGCPRSVSEPLTVSFRLFFACPSAASNSVRIALEELLTELKIKRYVTSNGKRSLLSLHRRIALLPSKFDELKEVFFAIKWLGNAGSHASGEVSTDDVLDTYELVSHLLDEVYASKSTKIKALAKKVNKKKGPAR